MRSRAIVVQCNVLRRYCKCPASRHGIPRVHQHIQKHLVHLCRVGQDRPQIGWDICSYSDRFWKRPTGNLDNFFDHMFELDEYAFAFNPSSECQDLSYDVCAALRRCLNHHKDLLSGRIGYFVPQDLDRHHDRRKDIVEIMGDTPGERTDAVHALGPQKVCRKSLFLGHIAGDYDDLRNHSFCIPDHAPLRVDGAFGAVCSLEAVFDPLSDTCLYGLLKNLLHSCRIVRMDLLKRICPF